MKKYLIILFTMTTVSSLFSQKETCDERIEELRSLYYSNNRNLAMEGIDDAIACDTSNWKGYYSKAEFLSDFRHLSNYHNPIVDQNKFKVSEIYFNMAVDRAADEVKSFVQLKQAQFYVVYQKWDLAKEYTSKLLEDSLEFKDRRYALFILGKIYEGLGEEEKAIEKYEETIALDSTYDIAYAAIAYHYITKEDYKKAFSYANKAYQINNKERKHLHNIGYCALELGKYEKALEIYNRKDSLFGEGDAYSINNKGYALYNLNHLDEAKEMYLKSLFKDPLNSFVYRNIGLLKIKENDSVSGCEYLKLAIDLETTEKYRQRVKELYIANCSCCKSEIDGIDMIEKLLSRINDPDDYMIVRDKIAIGSFCRLLEDEGFPVQVSTDPKVKKEAGVSYLILHEDNIEFDFTKEMEKVIPKEVQKSLNENIAQKELKNRNYAYGIGLTLVKMYRLIEKKKE